MLANTKLSASSSNDLASRLPGRIEPLDWLVELYGRTSDSFRLPDALAQLGDALVAAKQFDRAKSVLEQLVDRQPESDSAKRKLNDCLRKMGLLAPEESSAVADEPMAAELPEAPAPRVRPSAEPSTSASAAKQSSVPAEPALDEDTQRFIAQSLTDVDLFASYGLTQKAIGLLEAILRRAPRHTPTLEKLLDFVLGAGDDRRTAELASQLEQIHRERGDSRSADRFGELRRRFQRAAGLSDEDLAAAAAPAAQSPATEEMGIAEIDAEPVAPAAPPPTQEVPEVTASQPAPAGHEDDVHEVDLSDEWASLLDSKAASPAAQTVAPPASGAVKEFAVPAESASSGGVEEFSLSEESPVTPSTEAPHAAEVRASAERPTVEDEVNPFAAISSELPPPSPQKTPPATVQEISLDEILSSSPAPAPPVQRPAPQPAAPVAADSEFELEEDYELVVEQEALVPAHEQKPPQVPIVSKEAEPVAHNAAPAVPPSGGFASDQFLSDLANEIDQLGIGELTPAFSDSAAPAIAPPAASSNSVARSVESGPLKEVFDEFRAELGEMGAEDEDLETHYNLGIAFREMGLLEEAISEFQKVAKATDSGRAFRYTMQCCTLLGLAFMEQSQPAIAAIWYERALKTPSMDPESILALRYDLGVAQESAGEPDAALKSFTQVYAMNIDYRDVAERIAALQKPIR